MTKKTALKIRWIIGIFLLLALVLGAYSSFQLAGKPVSEWDLYEKCNDWADWIADFLIGGVLSIVGFGFVVFPKSMMRVLILKEESYTNIQAWRLIASGLLVGISLLLSGINFLIIIVTNWQIECSF